MSKPNQKTKSMQTYGFTAMDNRVFFLQERLTPGAFSLFIRLYRMIIGYDGKPKALANSYLQTLCNMSKNTVTKAVKELEDESLIYTKKRQRSSTMYLVNMEKVNEIYQEIESQAISGFGVESQNVGNEEILDSQILTYLIPESDHVESQNMGCTKKNLIKESSYKENFLCDSDLLIDFWNEHRPAQSAVKPKIWSKVVMSRLRTFTTDEIKQAMLSVINSQWHQKNGQVLIKNAIGSDQICAGEIEKSSQLTFQGTNYAKTTPSHIPHQSPASSNIAQLRERIAAEQAAKQSNNQNDYAIRTVH